jgi:hypothetical protein
LTNLKLVYGPGSQQVPDTLVQYAPPIGDEHHISTKLAAEMSNNVNTGEKRRQSPMKYDQTFAVGEFPTASPANDAPLLHTKICIHNTSNSSIC